MFNNFLEQLTINFTKTDAKDFDIEMFCPLREAFVSSPKIEDSGFKKPK